MAGVQCDKCAGLDGEHLSWCEYCKKKDVEKVDMVNNPPHYKVGGIESIDVIEAFGLGFNLGNTIKYILRHKLKGNPLQDLQKARWYLDREITNMQKEK